jgi:hypothetical protein
MVRKKSLKDIGIVIILNAITTILKYTLGDIPGPGSLP